jgi:uncharacterized protein (DUF1800 family)
MSVLDLYTGPWTRRHAAHLLRRASFGANPKQIKQAMSDGMSKTIDNLFTKRPLPEAPRDPETGLVWIDGGDGYNQQKGVNFYNSVTKSWWVGLMINDPPSIREKLTLFWQNHFSTEAEVVFNAIYQFRMHQYLRENCLGNFKAMVRQVTIEPAMLRYLNGNTNTLGSPNENYARELQELFSIGKGPVAGQGDYTYYTEQDVREAARVLTGWRDNRRGGGTQFVPQWHDTGDKQFSARYQNRIIKGRTGPTAGDDELNDLMDMIFSQERTAEYIIEKLYRWFVDSIITDQVKSDIIKPLAAQLRADNFVVEGVLRKLLSSQFFFSSEIVGAQLGSPADFIAGLLRTTTTWKTPSDAQLAHRFHQLLVGYMAGLQMDLFDPPSVAGWEAYYQLPGFDRIWITSATLPLRNGLSDAMLLPNRANDNKAILNTPDFVKEFAAPGDALALIDEINESFFTVPFTESMRMKLAEEVLMNGGRYYEWTAMWEGYIAEPSPLNTLIIKTYLDRLFRYLFRLAEYQLV